MPETRLRDAPDLLLPRSLRPRYRLNTPLIAQNQECEACVRHIAGMQYGLHRHSKQFWLWNWVANLPTCVILSHLNPSIRWSMSPISFNVQSESWSSGWRYLRSNEYDSVWAIALAAAILLSPSSWRDWKDFTWCWNIVSVHSLYLTGYVPWW